MTTIIIDIPDSKASDLTKYATGIGGRVVGINYASSKETELNDLSLAYAEKAFSEGWDVNDEENNYWNSFISNV